MSKKTSKDDNTVIISDKYISESGVQGGKVIGEHIALGSFIAGIPFFIIGLIALFGILLNFGFPKHTAFTILATLFTVIGFLLIIGGYNIYRTKHTNK